MDGLNAIRPGQDNKQEYTIRLSGVVKTMLSNLTKSIRNASQTFSKYQKSEFSFSNEYAKEYETLLFQMLSENKTVGLVLNNYLNLVFKEGILEYSQEQLEQSIQSMGQINAALDQNAHNIGLIMEYLHVVEPKFSFNSMQYLESIMTEAHILSLNIAMKNTHAKINNFKDIEQSLAMFTRLTSQIAQSFKNLIRSA